MTHKVIAITGKIGSGKSTVAQYLRTKGYEVIDCDKIGKDVSKEQCVIDSVKRLLGEKSVKDGNLDRQWIRQTLFSSELQLLDEYNKIFFDRIKFRLHKDIENSDRQFVFAEIPLLDAFDFEWWQVWVVKCDDDIQLNRVSLRDNVTFEQAKSVFDRQKDYKADVVINNDGNLQDLYDKVDLLLNKIEKDK